MPLRSGGERETKRRDVTLDTASSSNITGKAERQRMISLKEGRRLEFTSSPMLQLLDDIATTPLARALLRLEPPPTFAMPKF